MPGKFQHILISGTITAELPYLIINKLGFSIPIFVSSLPIIFLIQGSSALSNASVISSHRVAREGQCFLYCVQKPSCTAFKFKPSSIEEVNCILGNLTKNVVKGGKKGWIYYQEILVSRNLKYASI
jgi:hypothetical protein